MRRPIRPLLRATTIGLGLLLSNTALADEPPPCRRVAGNTKGPSFECPPEETETEDVEDSAPVPGEGDLEHEEEA